MNSSRWFEWAVAYLLGVASSITASFVLFVVKSKTIVNKTLQYLIKWETRRRLRNLVNKDISNPNDPRIFIRTQWANALFDLGSTNDREVISAIQSLNSMADLLESYEKVAAHEVLKLKYASNPQRNADTLYLETMQRLIA